MDGEKQSLVGTLTMAMGGVALVLVTLFTVLWLSGRLIGFSEETEAIRQGLLTEKKLSLSAMVDEAVAYVSFAEGRAAEELKRSMRDQVDLARALATQSLATRGLGLTSQELGGMVLDGLRPLVGHGGRSQLFVLDGGGQLLLGAVRPTETQPEAGADALEAALSDGEVSGAPSKGEREGLDPAVLSRLAAMARNGTDGYLRYGPAAGDGVVDADPSEGGDLMAFAVHFEPLDWVIGAAVSLADLRRNVRATVLDRFSSMRAPDGSYLFVGRWDGVSLVGPARGRNMIEATDLDGLKVVRELIEQAKSEPGFLTYRMPGVGDRPTARKLSYVRGVPQWEWYVGAGVFIDDLDAVTAERKERLTNTLLTELALGVGVLLVVGAGVFLAQRRLATRLRSTHGRFSQFLADAAHGRATLDPERMDYAEYRDLAVFANELIAARREAEAHLAARGEQLERSNRELERFAFIASHDLQEPLRNISGFIQLLDRRLGRLLDGESREFFTYVQDNVRRMHARIMGLLEYSRLDRLPLERALVPLDRLVAEVGVDLKGRLDTLGASLDVGDLPAVPVDGRQAKVVFAQLIDNALSFPVEGRPIRVRVSARREEDGRWWIDVADNGRGIHPEDWDRVFEVFKRLDGSLDRAGAGLGLSICRRVVDRHGGEIRLESTPGEGTTVSFTLTERIRRAVLEGAPEGVGPSDPPSENTVP